MKPYPIAPEFRRINHTMPYARPLFPLAGPVQRWMLRRVPLREGLSAWEGTFPGYRGAPVTGTLFGPAEGGGALPCLLLFHGGGFAYQAAPYHKQLAMRYAQALGCRVFFPDYHRLPRYPYPAAREDALQAYRFLCLQGEALGIRTDRIAVAGDSAGAVLATYVAGHPWGTLPAPCGQMLVYPVTDASQSTPSIRAYPDTPMWNARSNAKMWRWYLAGADAADRRMASPMAAPLAVRLPPTYLETAEFDCLHDEGLAYAARLRQHGTPVEVYETQGTLHGYDFCLEAPQTAASVQRRLAFLRRVLFPEA